MDKLPSDQISTTRYLVDELKVDPKATILNFEPGVDGRDEFGNRVFSSHLSYLDRQDRKVKAALLVSREGEFFIRENKGVVRDIDLGINSFAKKMISDDLVLDQLRGQSIEITPDRTMTMLDSGGQSAVFILDVSGPVIGKYIIKTGKLLTAEYSKMGQPYINEMLQVQTLNKIFGDKFKMAGFRLPQFLFASGHVSCSLYEGNFGNINMDDYKNFRKNRKLNRELRSFIAARHREGDLLWDGVDFDLTGNSKFLPLSNMVSKGNLAVWVDPFIYTK